MQKDSGCKAMTQIMTGEREGREEKMEGIEIYPRAIPSIFLAVAAPVLAAKRYATD